MTTSENHWRKKLSKEQITERVRVRFFKLVKKTNSCWDWMGNKIYSGYGQLRAFDRTRWSAHRLSWYLHNGDIPEGLCVLHRCDNRGCVNPNHLFLGTGKDNVDDKVIKNRQAKGERCNRKLTPDQVVQIRALKGSKSYSQMAKDFKVNKASIYAVVKRISWKHIP